MRLRLAINSVANLTGGLLPAIVSLLTIPFIVRSLGDTSYGVLTMVTAIIGYFAVLDINLTSGVVKFVAEYSAKGQRHELKEVISLGLCGHFIIGLIGCVSIYFFSNLLAQYFFNLPQDLIPIAIRAIKFAALGFLLNQLQVFLLGIPQGLERYRISALFDATFGMVSSILSVLVLTVGYGLCELVLLRVILASLNVALLALVVKQMIPDMALVIPSKKIFKNVSAFVGFSYLSKLSSLFYQYADTLIVGSMLGMTALTYLTIPFTLANRLFGMAYRLASVVFPAVSALNSIGKADHLREVYMSAGKYLFYVNACLLLLVAVFSREILQHWMDERYADYGSSVLTAIGLSLFIDSATNIPSIMNDGLGHPKVTGYFSAFRALLRLFMTIIAAIYFGIIGVAVGHVISTLIYAILLLFYVHGRTIPFRLTEVFCTGYRGIVAFTVSVYCFSMLIRPDNVLDITSAVGFASVTAVVLLMYGYWVVLIPVHRRAIKDKVVHKMRSQ